MLGGRKKGRTRGKGERGMEVRRKGEGGGQVALTISWSFMVLVRWGDTRPALVRFLNVPNKKYHQ